MTWEYEKATPAQTCLLDKNQKEPVGEKENQAFLKAVNATVSDMKKPPGLVTLGGSLMSAAP